MATTFTRLLVHVVFSTKNRAELIKPEIEQDLYAYMKGIAKNHGSPVLAIDGTADHVHLIVSLSKRVAVADLLENLKQDSSVWIKTQGPQYKRFYWQEGYGAFTIGESAVAALKRYTANQKAHHRRVTYQEELLTLLKKYQIEYDERYLWTFAKVRPLRGRRFQMSTQTGGVAPGYWNATPPALKRAERHAAGVNARRVLKRLALAAEVQNSNGRGQRPRFRN